MTQKNVKINFFGAFRKYGDYETLDLPDACSVEDLKGLLAIYLTAKVPHFADGQLIRDSAVACNDTIVAPDYILQPDETVAILPPVCGG